MSDERGSEDPRALVERWIASINNHDLDAIVACFDPRYEDEAPTRPGEHVRGDAEVRLNHLRLHRDLSDLRAELLDHAIQGDRVWMEWRMSGTREDGTHMEFAGVNIFQVRGGRFVRGRIYTELVREAGGIQGQIERMTKGAGGGSGP
jgi:ketosteroid isomerase-like protein